MLTSLVEFIPEPRVVDTGLPQQVELFEQVCQRTGKPPLVIDGKDVLLKPQPMLAAICDHLGVEFTADMLEWPAGARETDGAWAPFWYDKVNLTTRFGSYRAKADLVPDHLDEVYEECVGFYDRLAPFRLQV